MKTENWKGNKIRFVHINSEWWAVAKDVTTALGIASSKDAVRKMNTKYKGRTKYLPLVVNKK